MKKVLMFAGAVTAIVVASRFFSDGGGGVKNGRIGGSSGVRGGFAGGVADASGKEFGGERQSFTEGSVGNGFSADPGAGVL